jgi:hypothetical protein
VAAIITKRGKVITMLKLFTTNPQYRKFLLFQIFDRLGIGTFGIFMMWAVHDLFQSTFYTGLAGSVEISAAR